MALITVAIPARDAEAYVRTAVVSVLNNKVDLEVLVFDDASTDATPKILRELSGEDRRVRVITGSERAGIAGARNSLLQATAAKYMAPFDADDIMLPGWLDYAVAALEAAPDCPGVYGKSRFISAASADLGITHGSPFSRVNCYQCHPVPHGGVVVRRDAAAAVGGYMETSLGNDSVLEDFFIWCRFCVYFKMKFLDRYAYLYRKHAAQVTNKAERFGVCMDYIKNFLLSFRPGISDSLMRGESVAPADNVERNAAMLAIGILSLALPDEHEGNEFLLSQAATIDPGDYGLYLRWFNHHLACRRLPQAKEMAERLLSRFPEELYVQMLGHRLLEVVCGQGGDERGEREHGARHQQLMRQFSQFPS